MQSSPIPAPIFMSSMQAGVPPTPMAPSAAGPMAVAPARAAEYQYGAKIKIAALVAIAYWFLSSQPFFTILNGIICSFSLTAAPCVNDQGCGTMKGVAIGGFILFVFTMYLLGGL